MLQPGPVTFQSPPSSARSNVSTYFASICGPTAVRATIGTVRSGWSVEVPLLAGRAFDSPGRSSGRGSGSR